MIFFHRTIANNLLALAALVTTTMSHGVSASSSGRQLRGNTACVRKHHAEATIVAFAQTVVNVQRAYTELGCLAAYAEGDGALDIAYAYNLGPVLFKPTVSSTPYTFRNTKEGALSYFVGTDCLIEGAHNVDPTDPTLLFPHYNDANDLENRVFQERGFGTSNNITGFELVGFEYLTGDTGRNPAFCDTVVAAGQICFQTNHGETDWACVDKTFSLVKGDASIGQLPAVITSHHSSNVVLNNTQTLCQYQPDDLSPLPAVPRDDCRNL